MVSDIHRTVVRGQGGNCSNKPPVSDSRILAIIERPLTVPQTQARSAIQSSIVCFLTSQSSVSGEFPPPPPKTFFGRDGLVEKVIHLAEDLRPVALIGAGGIGKTCVALAVLHHDRIKKRFGQERRFIRCDQFPASSIHLLRRLSQVVGASVENPEDLTPLRPFLSSKEMLIVLDNAESILDPRGADAQRIYDVVEELSQFENLCLCITSRISTTPPDYKRLDVPTLSMDAALDTFYRIYDSEDRSDVVNGILEQLEFHPLSITLLATVGHQNRWDTERLAREWEHRRTSVLHTEHNKSLAAAIELSLASPLFRDLGPEARAILGVIAFFPQGVDEKNLDWLFSMISDRIRIMDKFCILSLTYRSNGFVTMLAPLREYLRPKDPKSSSLLRAVKERYFSRMSVHLDPAGPEFAEGQWIASEDINVEHLLDVFTTIEGSSDEVWEACDHFIEHLFYHKQRLTVLKAKIEGLPDGCSPRLGCWYKLGWLFFTVGNFVEAKRLLTHALAHRREGRDDQFARILQLLSIVHRKMGLYEEGIGQAKEAIEVYERLGDTKGQAECLSVLADLFRVDKKLDAAEQAALRGLDLLPEKGWEWQLCGSHLVLSFIFRSKGEMEKAIHHNERVIRIASPFGWKYHLFWAHNSLVDLFRIKGKFEDAQNQVEYARSNADNAYQLAYVMKLQAGVFFRQGRIEEARSELLRAIDAYEKLAATADVERCRKMLANRVDVEDSSS